MAMHETVRPMTDRQKSDIIATMVGAIPPLTFDEAQRGIIGAKGRFVAEIRAVFERVKARLTHSYPAVDEIFELTLDGDAHPPLEMVWRDGYSGNWKHKGLVVKGRHTRRFKLVQVGFCLNLDEVRQKLAAQGEIPEGQWREAFKAKYSTSDGNGPIGFPDASWTFPFGVARFPYVDAGGYSNFRWADDGFRGGWRWFVGVRK